MKKIVKRTIVIIIITILILIGVILIPNLKQNKNLNNNINNNSNNKDFNYSIQKSEIQNYIVFKTADYETINNIVFYRKNMKLDETIKNNLNLIANELKMKYPNKTILYLGDLGGSNIFKAKKIYRCIQIINGQIIYNTDMNVLIYEDGNIDIKFLNGGWYTETNVGNINITQAQAEEILIDYLVRHPESYNELRGFFKNTNEKCTVEFYKYHSKNSWKMNFWTGSSYVIIDAETGEILDKYFFCGVIVN